VRVLYSRVCDGNLMKIIENEVNYTI
jgi:hypothetical protein